MIGWVNEVRAGVTGCFALLTFKDDWRKHFDVSAEGVGRSFLGVILAIPAFAFTVASANHLVAENPDLVTAEARITLMESALIWLRFWFLFPIVAAGTAMLLRVSDRFAKWLVVHNWMVFTLIHIQALFWAFYMAGLADAQSFVALLASYTFLRLFVHWRVAAGALGVPVWLAAAAAGIPLLTDTVVRMVLA
jgi:hypothetical protein